MTPADTAPPARPKIDPSDRLGAVVPVVASAALEGADLTNVIVLSHRRRTSDIEAPAVEVNDNLRPVPEMAASRRSTHWTALIAAALLLHLGLVLLFLREPAPLPDAGLDSISVELEIGNNQPVGIAASPERGRRGAETRHRAEAGTRAGRAGNARRAGRAEARRKSRSPNPSPKPAAAQAEPDQQPPRARSARGSGKARAAAPKQTKPEVSEPPKPQPPEEIRLETSQPPRRSRRPAASAPDNRRLCEIISARWRRICRATSAFRPRRAPPAIAASRPCRSRSMAAAMSARSRWCDRRDLPASMRNRRRW